MYLPSTQVSGNPKPLFHTRHFKVLKWMVWSMGDDKNLILRRTAIFLLKNLRRRSLCSCQECLQSLISPRHLEDDLKLIIFLQYFNGTREQINICLYRSGTSDLVSGVISLLALLQD